MSVWLRSLFLIPFLSSLVALCADDILDDQRKAFTELSQAETIQNEQEVLNQKIEELQQQIKQAEKQNLYWQEQQKRVQARHQQREALEAKWEHDHQRE